MRRNRIFSADSSSRVEISSFLTQSVTETPLESQVLMQSVECHSKTAAVSEHCHHFSAFNEQCHISFSFKYPVDNFKFPTMPFKEFTWNSSEFISVWAHTNSISIQYPVGIRGCKENIFKAIKMYLRLGISRDAVHRGRELIMPG